MYFQMCEPFDNFVWLDYTHKQLHKQQNGTYYWGRAGPAQMRQKT